MPILSTENLICKSIEYAIDLPIDFDINYSVLRLLKGVLAKRYLTRTKSISIVDDESLKFTSYSFKGKLNFGKLRLPFKFQIYNKQLDLTRFFRQKDLLIPKITRFELTILSSHYNFSEQTLNGYKKLYYSFLKPITSQELILFEETIAFQLYKNFCQEKLEAPKLQITAFILKNSEHFMTKHSLYDFYQLLFNNKLSKTPAKIAFCKFKKTKNFANIKFSCVQELNNLIVSLRAQLS